MDSRHVSRRFVITALGSGVALAPLVARAAVSQIATSAAAESGEPASIGELLIAPLNVGSEIAGCRVEKVCGVVQGALGLVLSDREGQLFGIEVCAYDPEGPRGPATTSKFQLYIVNEGDGSVPTVEEHGLAAMHLAQVIRRNEDAIDASEFLSFRERLERFGGELIRPV